jgi:LPXTG-site transpeptidase (sortase) family protein
MTTTHHQPNPLIPNHAGDPDGAAGHGHHHGSGHSNGHGSVRSGKHSDDPVLKPPADPTEQRTEQSSEQKLNPAVDLIRQKLAAIYGEEPDTKAEIAEVQAVAEPRSKHQQYMYQLSNSGKTLAEIQTAWHQYYAGLTDDQKREVWQEFYDNSAKSRQHQAQSQPQHLIQRQTPSPLQSPAQSQHQAQSPATPQRPVPAQPSISLPATAQDTDRNINENLPKAEPEAGPAIEPVAAAQPLPQWADDRTAGDIRQQVRSRVGTRSKLKVKHHLQSLLFGLGFGGLVLVIVLFSFFNEIVIAPFIQPSRKVSATPIILGTGSVATDKNEVIIPKINLEIPLDFSAQTINESDIESGLENGVVHYPTTALPGQQGNASFFGHSSNNIFNPGKYKFAFVLLHELVPGDTFTINYKGVAYTYQVYDKKIVDPSDVSVLNPVAGKASTAVLITCDPPGTSLHRLVVWGEQVSPNPSGNVAAAPTPTTSGAQQTLPGNGPTLWRRLINTITGH